jgi:hypothetical protein
MARHKAASSRWRPSRRVIVAGTAVLAAIAAVTALITLAGPSAPKPTHHLSATPVQRVTTTTSSTDPPTTAAPTTKAAVAPTTVAPTTTVPLPAPGAGFVAGHVTAVGDSVMLDYKDPLEADVPSASVDATVSRQWSEGESILQSLKASGQLGAEVIVGLSTNGPITTADFDNMMAILNGASRVVFVNVHVDRPWQDPNNAVIASGAARYPNAVVADWATLAAQNPQWFGADGTHLAIDGQGADALASLVASTLANG